MYAQHENALLIHDSQRMIEQLVLERGSSYNRPPGRRLSHEKGTSNHHLSIPYPPRANDRTHI